MREVIDFCNGWYFHKGDIPVRYPDHKVYTYMSAKTERMLQGPASRKYPLGLDDWGAKNEFNGDIWTPVSLPHDFIVGGVPDEKENCGFGFLPRDNAWYIKRFPLSNEDKNKRIVLFFEGSAIETTVYLNGCLIKRNFSGYNSFEVDISDFVVYGETNYLAVYTRVKDIHEGWWYEGGGIYRPVRLIKTERVSVDLWGLYAKPEFDGEQWNVALETSVRNDYEQKKSVRVESEIVAPNGEIVAIKATAGKIEPREIRAFTAFAQVSNPELWSPETPTQYEMKSRVYLGKTLVDEQTVKFGFRTFTLTPNEGLFINGKHYLIKGLCGHADCGLMGKAVPDNIHRYKVRLMKEMGANAYRTSHYMQSEALMDALDENGFIVLNETRWFSSSDEAKEQLIALVKRDRNRPGVFFWSIGNEEPHHCSEEGRRITKTLKALVKKYDDLRPVMTAVSHSPERATVYDETEVIGVNYNWGLYDDIHEKYPNKGIFCSEGTATGTTRGWYFDDDHTRAYVSAYDHGINKTFIDRESAWKFITARKWLAGGFQWIAFEHRGEATWPRLCSQSGAIDLYLQKKDAFYQNRSHWSNEPMVHLLPHWNWKGMEGRPVPVWAYTNAEEAELFLNGKSLGRKQIERYGHGEWLVPYEAGKLTVNAYMGGKLVATDEKITTGKGVRLALALDTDDIRANGKDIAVFTCTVVDENGLEVPDASPFVQFSANGAGFIYSTGSDVSDHTPLFRNERKMRAGRIGVAVKLKKGAGELEVIAQAEGLESARFTVRVEE